MSDIPLVDIDPSGVFKYILINVHSEDKNGKESTIQIVRGYARATWHNDIYEEVKLITLFVFIIILYIPI